MELLLENPLIIIIIFGILSSVFRKLKGQKQKVKPPNRQASFTKTSVMSEQESITRSNQNTTQDQYQEKKAETKIVALKEQQRVLEQKMVSINSEKEWVTKSQSITVAPETNTFRSVGEQKLIDGVIWAEILGPPRSRNPHRVLKSK